MYSFFKNMKYLKSYFFETLKHILMSHLQIGELAEFTLGEIQGEFFDLKNCF